MKKLTRHAVVLVTTLGLGTTGLGSGTAGASSKVRTIKAEDRCDPISFGLAIPGICGPNKHESITFEQFLDELNPDDFGHDKWRFTAKRTTLTRGEVLAIRNTGGEAHTFTEVAEFGGGCIPELNDPLGLPFFAGDCGAAFAGITPPGQTTQLAQLTPGEHKFICILHPWMRATVKQKA